MPDQRPLQAIARRQNGAVGYAQLRAIGVTPSAIHRRVNSGLLWRPFPRAYTLVDPAGDMLARLAAALLSVGEDSVLFHRSAALVWRVIRVEPEWIHVAVPRRGLSPRTGMRLHGGTGLQNGEVTVVHNLRITSLARTLIDLATDAGEDELGQAFGEARAKCRLSDHQIERAVHMAPRNHPGAARIRRWLELDPDSTRTRAQDERLLRRLVRQSGLPQPKVGRTVGRALVDFIWPEHRLILELDTYPTHGHPDAFEGDRLRDQIHVAAGYTVIRVTRRQLREEPLAVIARIAQALARREAA